MLCIHTPHLVTHSRVCVDSVFKEKASLITHGLRKKKRPDLELFGCGLVVGEDKNSLIDEAVDGNTLNKL